LILLAVPWAGRAQVPGLINHQGRVVDNGTNFDDTGQFMFALIDSGGTTNYWSNDGTAAGQPVAAVSLAVTKGLYSVLLGDTTVSNMSAITSDVFANTDVWLRVWFNDGVNGFQQLSPDERLGAIGYAMVAAKAVTAQRAAYAAIASNVSDGAIGTAQLASNFVGSLAAQGVVTQNESTVTLGNGALQIGVGGTVTSAPATVISPSMITIPNAYTNNINFGSVTNWTVLFQQKTANPGFYLQYTNKPSLLTELWLECTDAVGQCWFMA
jgi:hypothetical protein